MQLDRTELVIRQRSALELFDLSLIVLRRHIVRIAYSSMLLGMPLIFLDVLLTSWMLGEDAMLAVEQLDEPKSVMRLRSAFHIVLLYTLQFPLISTPTTVFLGNQIFFEPLSIKALVHRLAPIFGRLVLILGAVRMGLLCLLCELMVDRNVAWDWQIEFGLLLVPGMAVLLIRACWPFAPEILALELCPIRGRAQGQITYAQRSRGLHKLLMADHVSRFLGAAVFAILLSLMLLAFASFGKGVVTGIWMWDDWFNWLVLPITLWSVGLFMAVYRFLSYLDSRIRLEGWEIELRLKAEAVRLQKSEQAPIVTSDRVLVDPEKQVS